MENVRGLAIMWMFVIGLACLIVGILMVADQPLFFGIFT